MSRGYIAVLGFPQVEQVAFKGQGETLRSWGFPRSLEGWKPALQTSLQVEQVLFKGQGSFLLWTLDFGLLTFD